MPTTTHGAPYPASGAPNNVPGDIQALATWTDDQVQVLIGLLAEQATPAGAIMAWDDPTPPITWHTLDGRAISRTDNPVLFARYGTTHGAGNGSTTFNLPNRKGLTLVGLDTTQTEFDSVGKTGGEKAHTLTAAETGRRDGNIVQQVNGGPFYFNVGSDSDGTHRATLLQPAAAGQAHNNLQPYAVTTWIIKAG